MVLEALALQIGIGQITRLVTLILIIGAAMTVQDYVTATLDVKDVDFKELEVIPDIAFHPEDGQR